MNQKITLPVLVSRLSELSGFSKTTCEEFLREFSSLVSESLIWSEGLKVPEIGVFKVMRVEERRSVDVNTGEEIEIPAHNKIVYTPSRELADAVNAPFSMFKSVEVNDDNYKNIVEIDNEADNKGSEGVSQEIIITETVIADVPIVEESISEVPDNPVDMSVSDGVVNEPTHGESDPIDSPESESEAESDIDPEKENDLEEETIAEVKEPVESETALMQEWETHKTETRKGLRAKFIWGFVSGLVFAAIVVAFAYFFMFNKELNSKKIVSERDTPNKPYSVMTDSVNDAPVELIEALEVGEATSVAVESKEPESDKLVPTQPSDQRAEISVVTDTITRTRYLTTMAKDHYGNYHLWPFIYEENKKILGHPDRIKPGTAVIIPDLKKYGVDAKNSADIDKAKKMGVEIYSRYK